MPPTTTTMSSLLTTSLRPSCPSCRLTTQIRHASLLRRPKRPYTFTQMITLSDGSTYLHRTTSPAPIYRSTKDTKNNPLWNPSSQKLKNVEEDEAGRLKRFRGRFGRGWDAEVVTEVEEVSSSCVELLSLQGSNADWWDHRRKTANCVPSLGRTRPICWILFRAMDKKRRKRARRLVLLSQRRRVERARAARSECEVYTRGMKQMLEKFAYHAACQCRGYHELHAYTRGSI